MRRSTYVAGHRLDYSFLPLFVGALEELSFLPRKHLIMQLPFPLLPFPLPLDAPAQAHPMPPMA